MPGLADAYTRYPRTLLWLIRGGLLTWRDSHGDATLVEVPSFYLSKAPVTNEQFEAFDPGFLRHPTTPRDDDPAVGVSYNEASAYCAWYAEVSRKPMRLPTAQEWRWACGGETIADPASWPQGAQLDELAWHAGNCDVAANGGSMPRVANRRHNVFGLYGMLGGVWDWTSTAVDRSADTPGEAGVRRWQCGGSYQTPASQLTPELWQAADETQGEADVGFRVVKPLRT